jgi:hypothetical protein
VSFAGTTHNMRKLGGGVLWVSEAGSVMGRDSDRVPPVGTIPKFTPLSSLSFY